MRVQQIMRKKVVTVTTNTIIGDALSLLRGNRIRHLPVIENEKLVGIISDRDLRDALPSVLCKHEDDHEILQKSVKEIMHAEVITAHPLDFVEDAAKTVYDHKVGSLPIVEGNQLVGIVTESDLLNSLVELFGVNKPSCHIEVEVEDKVGMLAEVSQVFRETQVNVTSVIVFPSEQPQRKNLVFRAQTIDPRQILNKLTERGFSVINPAEGGSHS